MNESILNDRLVDKIGAVGSHHTTRLTKLEGAFQNVVGTLQKFIFSQGYPSAPILPKSYPSHHERIAIFCKKCLIPTP